MSVVRRSLSGCALSVVLAVIAATSAASSPRTAVAAGDCTVDASLDSEERILLQLINQHRAQNGRAPLAISYKLTRAAQWKSDDLVRNRYFAHDDLDRTWVQRLRDCDYGFGTYLGENIAAGNSTAQATFLQWKNSSGHNANMLSSSYTAIGIGRSYGAGTPYGWYWTTDFGGYNDGWVDAIDSVAPVTVDQERSTPEVRGGRRHPACASSRDVLRVDGWTHDKRPRPTMRRGAACR